MSYQNPSKDSPAAFGKQPKQSHSDASLLSAVLPPVLLIIIAPIVTFFVCQSFLFEGLFGWEETTAKVLSAIAAVVIMHLILGVVIYRAAKVDAKQAKMD